MDAGEQQIVEPWQLVRWQLQAQRIECCPAGSRPAGRAEARAVRKADREIGQLEPLRAAVAGQRVAIAVYKANIIRHLHRGTGHGGGPTMIYLTFSKTIIVKLTLSKVVKQFSR